MMLSENSGERVDLALNKCNNFFDLGSACQSDNLQEMEADKMKKMEEVLDVLGSPWVLIILNI